MFKPHFNVLPPPQKKLWKELAEVPRHFVLYGGTALALRLGHRQSVDFDFFSSRSVDPEKLLSDLSFLRAARIIQNTSQTLTVLVDREGPVKLSFFGSISMGRVGMPEETPDGVLSVASLLDLAGTKAKVVLQRAESKDYLDLLAIVKSGINLSQAMAAARVLYGKQYNSMLTIKSLTYFGDGDLYKLTPSQKNQLTQIASSQKFDLPSIQKLSNELSETLSGDSV
jgi:predicted nucleotidyltransferase component of viral defense system